MRRILRSILGWTGFLLLMFGGYLVYSGLGLNMDRILIGALIMAIAFIVIKSATNLGWNSLVDIDFIAQFFRARYATARERFSPEAEEVIQPVQKSELPRLSPPIKLRRYLLTISLFCLLFALALQMIEYTRGMAMWGHAMLDIVAYAFIGIAALFYFLTLLLNVIFSLRGRR